MTAQQNSLADDFKKRASWFSNRSSAIFPLWLQEGTDFYFVFLNYWKIKNGIEDVTCNVRCYDEQGQLSALHSFKVNDDHNAFSVRDCDGLQGRTEFKGMAEIEILSGDNLRFTFPGLVGYFLGREGVSMVHSAGRIRNAHEAFRETKSTETNWTCKFQEGVTPFFHIFNGPRNLDQPLKVQVALRAPDSSVMDECEYTTSLGAGFSSEIVLVKELFDRKEYPANCFVSVTLPSHEVFPRLVVGNYHINNAFLEATHSFPQVEISDFVPPVKNEACVKAFLPCLQPKELALSAAVFPTNADATVTGRISRKKYDQERLEYTDEKVEVKTRGEFFNYDLAADEEFVSLDFWQGDIPSRFNTSYRYSVRDSSQPYSTDIATAVKPWIYPPKRSHWGHGLIGDGFETTLMVRNMSHDKKATHGNRGRLTLYYAGGHTEAVEFTIPEESSKTLYLSQYLNLNNTERHFVSWFLKMDNPDVETFFVSYNHNGEICGEHGF